MQSAAAEPKPKHPWWLAVALLYAAGEGLAWAAGFRMQLDWRRWQLLDPAWLRDDLAQSLWLLHGQPPLLNLVAGLVLRVGDATGLAAETVAWLLFGLLGLVSVLGFFAVARKAVGAGWAWTLSIALLANPGFWVFRYDFFYPFPLFGLFVALLWASQRHLATGAMHGLVMATAVLLTMHWLRMLYPPVFGFTYLLALVTLRRYVIARGEAAPWRPIVAVLVAHLALGQLWPIKNAVAVGSYSHSSWQGFNLVHAPGETPRHLGELWTAAATGEATIPTPPPAGIAHVTSPIVRAVTKQNGSVNMNHYALLLDVDDATRAGIAFRLHHPLQTLRLAARFYVKLNEPTYIAATDGQLLGPEHAAYRSYARAWARPGSPVPIGPLMVPLWAIAIVPLVVGLAATQAYQATRRRRPEGAVMLLGILVLAWQVTVICLTDGQEGNRMRIATLAPQLLLWAWAFAPLAARLSFARREPAS